MSLDDFSDHTFGEYVGPEEERDIADEIRDHFEDLKKRRAPQAISIAVEREEFRAALRSTITQCPGCGLWWYPMVNHEPQTHVCQIREKE